MEGVVKMDGSDSSECPVCGQAYPLSSITNHVNECLNNSNKQNKESTNVKKRKSDENKTISAWSFLNSSSKKSTLPSKKLKLNNSKTSPNSKNSEQVSTESVCDLTKESDMKEKSNRSVNDVNVTLIHRGDGQKVSSQTSGLNMLVKSSPCSKEDFTPLAERMRPKTLENYVGQDSAVGEKSLLYSLLRSRHIPSMILWGPPGCGKTTLARIIANNCKSYGNIKFVQLSASTSGVNDVKQVIGIAKNDQKLLGRKTILFLDEIHRFNKTQQDCLLPHVEDGTVVLIGATTENPSFQVNSALLSRCRVIVLEKLSNPAVETILYRAVEQMNGHVVDSVDEIEDDADHDQEESPSIWVESQALKTLAYLCDGDGRIALNGLQMAVQSRVANLNEESRTSNGECKHCVIVNTDHIKKGLERSHVPYDKTGEEHYNCISAMHKAVRGSDPSGVLYWMARMLEGGETPLYVARRLVRMASEDIGLADPSALVQAVATYQACHFIGMPECEVILAQCATYLARAPKSVEVYEAYNKAKAAVKNHEGPLPSVPLHLRNAPTTLMKNLGYGKDYKYNPHFSEPVDQDYLPECLRGTDFFE